MNAKGVKTLDAKKDKDILITIIEVRVDEFPAGSRKVKLLTDSEGNNVFHLVDNSNWPKKMTDVITTYFNREQPRPRLDMDIPFTQSDMSKEEIFAAYITN